MEDYWSVDGLIGNTTIQRYDKDKILGNNSKFSI